MTRDRMQSELEGLLFELVVDKLACRAHFKNPLSVDAKRFTELKRATLEIQALVDPKYWGEMIADSVKCEIPLNVFLTALIPEMFYTVYPCKWEYLLVLYTYVSEACLYHLVNGLNTDISRAVKDTVSCLMHYYERQCRLFMRRLKYPIIIVNL